MTKNECLIELKNLAWQKSQYEPEYVGELDEIIDEWNDLVPVAEKLGISHAEMRSIWNGNGLSAEWRR